jgi:hypothetical protein
VNRTGKAWIPVTDNFHRELFHGLQNSSSQISTAKSTAETLQLWKIVNMFAQSIHKHMIASRPRNVRVVMKSTLIEDHLRSGITSVHGLSNRVHEHHVPDFWY